MRADRLFELRRRTFDTPNFRGIEFIEVEAKSIINKVPGNYLPFEWTINPYRGCSHSCRYCMSGETPILMADGRAKPLKELEVGDGIYGTAFDGKYRRYVTTEVLARWQTVKRAFRVTLEDGTELTAGGDHRFLVCNRGWKHVVNTLRGERDRPHLTLNNKLLGVGRFAQSPEHNEMYRRGYLCGLVRADGYIGTHAYLENGSGKFLVSEIHLFRLALADSEALDRAREFLRYFNVETNEAVFQRATAKRREIRAIRTGSRSGVAAVRSAIAWPRVPDDDWCKGFLGGIYDAEGGLSAGILRLFNTDPEIIDRVTSCMRRFGFSYALETQRGANRPVSVVRVTGGLKERLRFFLTVDPAITRKKTFEGAAIKSDARLRVVAIEDLGIEIPMYDITTGTGDFIADGVVSHNCFARTTHTYMDMNAGRDFESKIVVKVNAPEVLRRELRTKKWRGDSIAMGTATDPYQRAEGRYRLTRRIVETLTEYRNPFSILTKGTLILRDIDLLAEAARVTDVSAAFSVGTVDDDVWRRSEPGTPHPRKRLDAVARLNAAGVPCAVLVAPVLPGISDSPAQLRAVVSAAFDAGATHVSPILLHLRPGVKEVYMEWLESNFPELVPKYQAMYPGSYAIKAEQKAFSVRMSKIIGDRGAASPSAHRRADSRERARRARRRLESEQLRLI